MNGEKLVKTIRVVSCGAKYGAPPEGADLLIDCRGFINPHYDEALRPLTGADKKVRDFLEADPQVTALRDSLSGMLAALLPGYLTRSAYHKEKDVLLVFMCTGGKHRSRYFTIEAARISQDLVASHPEWGAVQVVIEHRESVET